MRSSSGRTTQTLGSHSIGPTSNPAATLETATDARGETAPSRPPATKVPAAYPPPARV